MTHPPRSANERLAVDAHTPTEKESNGMDVIVSTRCDAAIAQLRGSRASRPLRRWRRPARRARATSRPAAAVRGMRLTVLAACAVVAGVLAFAPVSAFAKQARVFSGSFGAASSTPANPYPLSEPAGVAVDSSTHDIYVADTGNDRVEKFDASGNFLLAFGADVGGPGVNVCGGVVMCAPGTVGSGAGQFTKPKFVAVDDSGGPSQGDVYVLDVGDNTLQKFNSAGELLTGWGSGGQLDLSSTPLGPSEGLDAVAIDPSGNLWVAASYQKGTVLSNAWMLEFKQDGTFVTGWNSQVLSIGGVHIAVGSEDAFVLGQDTVKFDTAGHAFPGIVNELSPAPRPKALALDTSTNALYMLALEFGGGKSTEFILRYDASCQPKSSETCKPDGSFGMNHLTEGEAEITVDTVATAHPVYVAQRSTGNVLVFSSVTVPDVSTANASNLTTKSATLNGSVNPDGLEVTECFFEWGQSTEPYEHVAPCENAVGAGATQVDAHAKIALEPGATYHYRLVAANANDALEPSRGQDLLLGPPLIATQSAMSVDATAATVAAEVDPQGADTAVRVEYGTDATYGSVTTMVDIGAGDAVQAFTQRIQGLSPATVYHYRVTAESAFAPGAGAVHGSDGTFTTQSIGSALTLPDGRHWEMVTPPDKRGAELLTLGSAPGKASAAGNAFVFGAAAPTEAAPEGFANELDVLSLRAPEGWVSRDQAAAHETSTGISVADYPIFSEDLSLGLLQPSGRFTPSLSSEASEQTAYLHTNLQGSESAAFCTSACYRPLVTGCPATGTACAPALQEHANVTAGTVFGEEGNCPSESKQSNCGPQAVAATPDLGHVVLTSGATLVQGAPSRSLYEWSRTTGKLALVSVLPCSPAPCRGEPATGTLFVGATLNQGRVTRHVVSDDGSRIVWGQDVGGTRSLYLRDTSKDETVQLDAVAPGGSGNGRATPYYQTASSDANTVFFTDNQQLTEDAGGGNESGEEGDLYRCAIVEEAGHLHCSLTDLTPPSHGEPAHVLSTIVGASDDGSWVYFVANGRLTEGAPQGTCNGEGDPDASCNLYVWHAGVTRLVAVLSGADTPAWTSSFQNKPLDGLAARVSPNGRWLAFTSEHPLTAYDTRDARTGRPDEEVYIYDASSERLACASCNPTNALPLGIEYGNMTMNNPLGVSGLWTPEQGLAGSLPAWEPFGNSQSVYQPRFLSNSGRLFFNSSDALVSLDTNGTGDVYEFEPAGVGDCSTATSLASVLYVSAADGCIGLISSGTSREESLFMDASESGGDVFFLTAAQLSPADVDRSYDVYDAHECASGAPCHPVGATLPPPCATGETCKPPPTPQPGILGLPASATFSGPESPAPAPVSATKSKHKPAEKLARTRRACRAKRNRRRRVACERTLRRSRGAAHKTTKTNRRRK